MLANVTFKHVIDHCRAQVLAEPDSKIRQLELTVLDRWKKHGDINGAWERIEKAAIKDGKKSLPAEDFIAWVLDQARVYNSIVVEEVIPQSPALERRAIAWAEREWRKTRNAVGAESAGRIRDLALRHRANRVRILGRQPNPRKVFINLCRDLFLENCGQSLDAVIETLVYVVFGREPKNNEVRDALKPTTRKGRHSRQK
jgi:hypothetical protein